MPSREEADVRGMLEELLNTNHRGGGASPTTHPAAGTSAPTDVSLREFFLTQLVALRSAGVNERELLIRIFDEKIDAQRTALDARINSETELRRARREDDLLAVHKAEQAMNARLDSMNEIREQLNLQAQTFARLDVLHEVESKMEEKINRAFTDIRDLREGMAADLGRDAGSRLTTGSMITVTTVVVAVLGLIVVAANAVFQ